MKYRVYLLLAMFFLGLLESRASTTVNDSLIIDKVVAKIGGEYVLYSELMSTYKYQLEKNPLMDESALCPLLEQIIAQKLLINQAKLDSIEVSPEEIESQLDYRISNILRMMNGDEERFQEFYGKTIYEVKEGFRDDIEQQLLAERIQQKLIGSVSITPKEVVTFFNKIPVDSLPYLNAEVELSELVLVPEINAEERQLALDKMTGIRDRIVAGEDFAALAQKYSQDQGSGSQGGDLGWQKRGSFVTEFEAAAFNLSIGELSEVVETEFGFHIMELLGRRGNTLHLRHILIKPNITYADLEKTEKKLDSLRQLIVADSLDFNYAIKLYGYDEVQSYHNNGRMINPTTGDAYFETGDLPYEVYFEIENMKVSDVSNVIEYTDPSGQKLYRIVKLEAQSDPHIANLQQDYSRIQRYAKESKKNEYYNDWIVEKLEKTYIEVDPNFGHCDNLLKWVRTEN